MGRPKGSLNKKGKNEHSAVRVSKASQLKIKIISKASGIPISHLIDEYISQLFDIASTWKLEAEGLTINYLPSLTNSYVMVQALARTRILQSGTYKITSALQDEIAKDSELEAKIFENITRAKNEMQKAGE